MRELGPYRALEHTFSIRSEDEAVARTLDGVLRPLLVRGATPAAATRYRIRCPEPGWFDVDDGVELIARVDDASVVVEHLVWILNRRAVDSWAGTLLHGGAVESPGGQGVIVVGRSGAGKSTTVTALVQSGFGYLSDELIPIEQGGSIRAHPRSIALKSGSWAMVEGVPTTAVTRDRSGQRHVDPAALGARIVARTTAHLIVALDRPPEPGAPVRIDELRPAAAVHELAHHAFDLPRLGAAGLEAIRSVVAGARTVTLRGGSPEERVRSVNRLLVRPVLRR